MIILGIDPGPSVCGVVVYDTVARRVVVSHKEVGVMGAIVLLHVYSLHLPPYEPVDLVAIERVQSYGISGGDLLRTAEVCGRLWQASAVPVRLVYRREVLRALDVSGRGNRDSLVRARLIEMHGGTRREAQGLKRSPGPLYGVAGHAWAALGVAVAAEAGAGSSG